VNGHYPIKAIHIELTSHCNAHCPQCARNREGGLPIASLPMGELRLADLCQILPQTVVQELDRIQFCGVYGEPTCAQDFLAICAYLKACNSRIELELETNGSTHDTGWWAETASMVQDASFGIDGLEDTHSLYRRGTQWEKVLANATAYLKAGGRATWVFLVFRHNEHQVEEARRLSHELGFHRFQIRRSSRFFAKGVDRPSAPVRHPDGTLAHLLEPPRALHWRNANPMAPPASVSAVVSCPYERAGKVFLSFQGLVFPCCYLAKIYREQAGLQEQDFVTLLRGLDQDLSHIDGLSRPLGEILRGAAFTELHHRLHAGNAPPDTCRRSCGIGNPNARQSLPGHSDPSRGEIQA
jgi:MoaA/NifB/PqqE/SkfB family radical SAM enzyme